MPRKKTKVVKKKESSEGAVENFETALSELENIVNKLETGETSLDKALELYENGIALSKYCSGQLKDAERRVELLEDKKGGLTGTAFDDDQDDDELDWDDDDDDDDDMENEIDDLDDLDDDDEEEDDDEDDFEDEEEDEDFEDEDRPNQKKGRLKKQDELF